MSNMLKICLTALNRTPLSFLIECVHIWHNEYISYVDDSVVKGQKYFKYVLVLVLPNPLSFFDGGCSYLAQRSLRIMFTDMTGVIGQGQICLKSVLLNPLFSPPEPCAEGELL